MMQNSRKKKISGIDMEQPQVELDQQIDYNSNTLNRCMNLARGLDCVAAISNAPYYGDIKKLKKVVDRSYNLLGGSFPERIFWRFFPSSQKSIDRCIDEASSDIKAHTDLLDQYKVNLERSQQGYFASKTAIVNMWDEIELCEGAVLNLEEMIKGNFPKIEEAKQSKTKKGRLQGIAIEKQNMAMIEDVEQKKKQAYLAASSIKMKLQELLWHEGTMEALHKLYSLTQDYVAYGSMMIEHAKCLKDQQINGYQFEKARVAILHRLKELSASCDNYTDTLVYQHTYLSEKVNGDGHFLRSLVTGKPINGVKQEPNNYQSTIDQAKKIADSI